MTILKRLIPFARPLHHFLPEYLIYTFFGILFGLLNFTLLIPILQLLFEQTPPPPAIRPTASVSLEYARELFNYLFFDIIARKGKFAALVFVCLIIAFSIFLSNAFKYMAIRVMMRLRLKLMEGIRNQLYRAYLHQSLSFHQDHAKGQLLQVLTGEVQEIESSVVNSIQILLRDPLIVLAYFGILFYWSPTLTLFTLLFLPVTGIVISALTRKLKRMNYFSQEMMEKIMRFADESIGGVKQIQSFVAEAIMQKRFQAINRDLSKHSKRIAAKKELASPISEVIGVIAAVTLVIFGGYLILNHQTSLSGSGFIAFLALYTQIIPPLKNLSQTSSTLQRGIVACEKIFAYTDAPVRISDKEGALPKKSFEHTIELKGVGFRYGTARVLQDINLTISKGKTIALVGQSGSGKSTLVDLIARFYDVEEGAVLIDGIDIKDMSLADLRSLVGIVTQDNFLFNETVYNNILLGDENATQERVKAAAAVAHADEFIRAMENGYESYTGERGIKLSGGQRQRISIARAILKNAPILIMDEATSALDTESEKMVQEALQELLKNRTSIIIAHRLSTVRHADEIVVLHEGKIMERGSHDTLMQQNGYYKRLVDLQEIND